MGTGYNFTDFVRRTLQFARQYASWMHHPYVGPEHVFFGLLTVPDSTAAKVLSGLGASVPDLRSALGRMLPPDSPPESGDLELPYTARAKKVLELAMTEARGLGHGYIGTEHLLLGLLGEGHDAPADVLRAAGITLEKARAEAAKVESQERSDAREMRAHRVILLSPFTAIAISIFAVIISVVALLIAVL